jgi:ATP-dependent Lhr-like helicase
MWATTGSWCGFRTERRPTRAAAARSRRSRGAGRAAARRDGAVRREVPRERRARAAAARAAGHARAAVAAAQARRRSARGRVALRIVSDAARDLSRVPARRLRHAGAVETLRAIRSRKIRVVTVDSRCRRRSRRRCSSATSPAYIYDGDAPLAERRAQALSSISRSCASCSATPSCASCSTPTRWTTSSAAAAARSAVPRASADGVHDCCCARRSDARRDRARVAIDARERSTRCRARGAIRSPSIAGDPRSSRSRTPRAIATRSACRCRRGCPIAARSRSRDPLGDLALRYARTHGRSRREFARATARRRRRSAAAR